MATHEERVDKPEECSAEVEGVDKLVTTPDLPEPAKDVVKGIFSSCVNIYIYFSLFIYLLIFTYFIFNYYPYFSFYLPKNFLNLLYLLFLIFLRRKQPRSSQTPPLLVPLHLRKLLQSPLLHPRRRLQPQPRRIVPSPLKPHQPKRETLQRRRLNQLKLPR